MFVDHDTVAKEYPKELERLLNTLKASGSKYKDTAIEKMHFGYNFSFFVKKGKYTPDYVEETAKLPFDERYEHELSKVRVSIVLSAGYFYVSDRVQGVSDTIKEAIKYTTAQKMKEEAEIFEDDSLLNSIPELNGLQQEQEPREITLEEQLSQAIDQEDFEQAAKLRDEIAKNSK